MRSWFRRRSMPVDLESRIRARGAVLDMPFVRSLYGPLLENQRRDGVRVERDIAYGSDSRQRLDLYQPDSKATSPRGMMLFLPGGGFVRGDKSERENFCHYFARQNLTVAVVNYRLAPAHTWPAGAEDAVASFCWARDHATEFGSDPSSIFLTGESAGAAHVAAATLVRRFHPSDGLSVAGTVLISGVYDPVLERLAREQFGVATPDPRNEPYFGTDFARYQAMSTVSLIDATPSAPLLITFAELDLLQMQVQAGELFARLVTEHGFAPQLRVIPGHNHLTQGYAVNTGDESLSAPLLEFMRASRGSIA
jgi:acetyl esterase